jgi:serine/alanine adding enzyme
MKSIYMDERWGRLQQEKENGKAEIYVFEQQGMKVKYPFIKREAGIVRGVKYYDLVTPRGQCGLWLENCEASKQEALASAFDEEFRKYCLQENIIAEYVRFSPWTDYSRSYSSIYDIIFYGYVYCNDLTCDFFKEEYSSMKRRNIRKAEKNGIEVVFDTACSTIDDFLRMYAFTESKYAVGEYYMLDRAFIERYCHAFFDEVIFAHALYKGEIISSVILLMGEDIAHYHFGGGNPQYAALQATSLLLYKAALFSAEKGKKLFDLGGAKAGSALESFKQEFVARGKKYPYYLGTKVRNKEIYDELVKQAGGPREGYFPAYRR